MKKHLIKILILTIVLAMVLSSTFLFAGCGDEEKNTDFVEETVVLKITSLGIIKPELSDVIILLIDENKSDITLSDDGIATIQITIKAAAITAINGLLANLDLSEGLLGLDLEAFFDMYPAGIFPGLSIDDIAGAFELIKASLGLQIAGLDFEDPAFAELATALQENGSIPDGFKLPVGKDYAVIITAPYVIRELSSPYSGDYTAVYLGQLRENEETYVIMTAKKDEFGTINYLRLHIEFLQLTILASAA